MPRKSREPRLYVIASEGTTKREEPHFVRFRFANGEIAMHSEQHPDYWKALRAANSIRRAMQLADSEVDTRLAAGPRKGVGKP